LDKSGLIQQNKLDLKGLNLFYSPETEPIMLIILVKLLLFFIN